MVNAFAGGLAAMGAVSWLGMAPALAQEDEELRHPAPERRQRAGPLGDFGLLYTPGAMVLVQTVLTTPIVIAIVHRAAQEQWARHGDAFQVAGATGLQIIPHLLLIARRQVLTAVLAALGRAISEVGAIVIVGGNIAGVTRTMTTTIMLETSKGNLPLALALGLVLIMISIALNGVAFALADRREAK